LRWKGTRGDLIVVLNYFFAADCELLLLYKEDFDEILKDTLEEKYENIRTSLKRFEYFKNYTEAKVIFNEFEI
jgi:hypothetical protein